MDNLNKTIVLFYIKVPGNYEIYFKWKITCVRNRI